MMDQGQRQNQVPRAPLLKAHALARAPSQTRRRIGKIHGQREDPRFQAALPAGSVNLFCACGILFEADDKGAMRGGHFRKLSCVGPQIPHRFRPYLSQDPL